MRIAVFSDIHGNLQALKSTLEQISDKKPDQIVFLGDIFQRGNEEIECLELLKNSKIVCIKGNCELYLANGVDIDPDEGKVVSVSASGLDDPSYLLIEASEDELRYEHMNIVDR